MPLLLVLLVAARPLHRRQTNEVERLRDQLRELKENFERVQQEQRRQIQGLTKRLDEVTQQQAAEVKGKAGAGIGRPIVQQPAPGGGRGAGRGGGSSPAQPLTVARAGSAYMNISFEHADGCGMVHRQQLVAKKPLGARLRRIARGRGLPTRLVHPRRYGHDDRRLGRPKRPGRRSVCGRR